MADNMGRHTITAANSIFMLQVPGLYDSPVRIEGFSTDAAVGADAVTPSVAEFGVDGHLSIGWVPVPKVITVTLAADSPSLPLLMDWIATQDAAREVYVCNATFTMPAINQTYVGTRGVITNAPPMPTANKTLQPLAFQITFESWAPSPL